MVWLEKRRVVVVFLRHWGNDAEFKQSQGMVQKDPFRVRYLEMFGDIFGCHNWG